MRKNTAVLAALALLSCPALGQHKYDIWTEPFTAAGLLGAVQYEDLKFAPADAEAGETARVDVSRLPQLGGAWTTMPQPDRRFQYGLETAFLLGFKVDKINYVYAGSGGIVIHLSTSMWMFDLSGGTYASLFLDRGRKIRAYAGTGPLLLYAQYRTEADYSDTTPTKNSIQSIFGMGWYARTGVEFRVHRRGMLGLGARWNWARADFTEVGGSAEIDGAALFATYTAGF